MLAAFFDVDIPYNGFRYDGNASYDIRNQFRAFDRISSRVFHQKVGLEAVKNTRTPIHDHVRKKCGWSDTQVVVRFLIIQVILAAAAYMLVR